MIYQGSVLVRWKAAMWINQSRAAMAFVVLLFVITFTQFSQAGLVIVGKDGKAVEQPPSRHALVIGIADYDTLGKINNTVRDAELLTSVLEELGFAVQKVTNPSRAVLKAQIDDYARKISKDSNVISVVYFTGHGAEVGGATYLVPRDFALNSADDLKFDSITVASLMETIARGNRQATKIYLIDTSRSDPFSGGDEASKVVPDSNDITRVNQGDMVVYSTSAGAEAMDGAGENGPFIEALVSRLREPGLEFGEVVRKVRNDVLKATGGTQVPQDISALTTSYYFNTGESLAIPEEPPETKAAKVLYRKTDGDLEPTYADGSYALLIGVGDYAQSNNAPKCGTI